MSDLERAVEAMVELAEEVLASAMPDGEAREKVASIARAGRSALAAAEMARVGLAGSS